MSGKTLWTIFKTVAMLIFILSWVMLLKKHSSSYTESVSEFVVCEHLRRIVIYSSTLGGIASLSFEIQGYLFSQLLMLNPSKKFMLVAFRLWILVGSFLVLLHMAHILFLNAIVPDIANGILDIMRKGISMYLTSEEWKNKLDILHQRFECCGIDSIADWFTTAWIPLANLRPNIVASRDIVFDNGTLGTKVVPSSCCDPNANVPCFHDEFQLSPDDLSNDQLKKASLFTRGCGDFITEDVLQFVVPHQILATILVVLQVYQMILGKWIYEDVNLRARGNPDDNDIVLTDIDSKLKHSEFREIIDKQESPSSQLGNGSTDAIERREESNKSSSCPAAAMADSDSSSEKCIQARRRRAK